MSNENLIKNYQDYGVVDLRNIYQKSDIEKWNSVLDPFFKGESNERKYVKCNQLFELGILDQLLNKKLINSILTLEPNPVLFHCHAYEIPANKKINHIGFHEKDGWHRDFVSDKVPDLQSLNAFSIFIYLTDVEDESFGAFELLPSYFFGDDILFKPSRRFFGAKGTSFIWDRSLYHRPHPNTSKKSRRIIKLSIQSNGQSNTRINLDEFTNVLGYENCSIFIKYLCGANYEEGCNFKKLNLQPSNHNIELNDHFTNSRVLYFPKLKPLMKKVLNKVI